MPASTALPATQPLAEPLAQPVAALCMDEQRPRDFSVRITHAAQRRGRAARARGGMRLRLGVTLLGAVALPAFAAPGGWDAFSISDAAASTPRIDPLPFERAGDSFPGSAFYYVQLDSAVPGFGEGIHSDAEPAPRSDVLAPPVARALRVDNSGVDRGRAEQCLTAAIYYEAASEPDGGQRAVAQVVLNRVAHPAYPNTVCGVVYQGSERSTGCQFSFTCDGSLARQPNRLFWDRAASVARQALAGYVYAPAGLATHYHTLAVHPYWAPSLRYLSTIGAHRFYSFNGAAGQPGVFRFAYLGGEPAPVPHRREETTVATSAAAPVLDPLAIQRAYQEALARARAAGLVHTVSGLAPAAAPPPAPTYTSEFKARGGDALYQGNNLPQGDGVRTEYQDSGRWIASPTG